ncbi:7626_t:CDS:2 [Ambispora gerdemannii]|uniref:7626_t:CDS:1 n=1 Tax=Ambispora gerdemannii TaxID=144530 RepID=A0A9N8V538_9GLOM|nr:7626_t:CDS:2 [Ambispora gerdemannii]
MRELFLVRKLEEENAKNQPAGAETPNGENINNNDLTTAIIIPSTTNSNSDNIDNSNQDNLEASNLKDPSHKEPAFIDEQQPHDNLVNDFEKLHVESEAEILTSTIEDNTPELTEEERQEKEAQAQALLTRRESLKQYFIKKQSLANNTNGQIDNSAEDTSADKNTKRESLKEYFAIKRAHNKDNSISSLVSEDTDDGNIKPKNSEKDNSSSSQNMNADAEEKRQKAAIARRAQRKQLMELKRQKKRQVSGDTEDIFIAVPEKKKNPSVNDESTAATTSSGNNEIITPKSSTHSLEGNESDDSLDWDAILAQTGDLESGIDSGLVDVMDDDDENFWNLDKIDTSELQKHLSPLSRSPDPMVLKNNNRNINIKEDDEFSHALLTEEVDDITANLNTFPENSLEEDEFDRTLDTQLTPVLEPTIPSKHGKNLDVDNMELDGRLSITPHRQLSPDPRDSPNLLTLMYSVKEEEDILLKVVTQEVDDITANSNNFPENSQEEDDFDRTLDVQMSSMIDPKSPSPIPSLRTSHGGFKGIPVGLPKPVFSSHFGSSPSSSRASSVADHDEYETMSNGSMTSVMSSNSTKSANSARRQYAGLRKPNRIGTTGVASKIASPNRQMMTSPTPGRPRSMSVVSNSSADESTTSTASRISSPPPRRTQLPQGTPTKNTNSNQIPAPRQRTLSGASNSSRDEARAAVASKSIATPVRPLSRAGLNQTRLPSGISRPSSPTQIRGSLVGEGAKQTTPTRTSTLPQASNITPPSGLARPSSRAGIQKTPGSASSSRPSSRLSTISESKPKTSTLYNNKKPRPMSIAVSPNSAASRITSPTGISNRPGSSMLRTSGLSGYNGGRRSSDSLSSYEEYSLFSPPESPTNGSETDSLTSLTSSVSYGSSPGRGTSPIPPTLIGNSPVRKSGVGVTRSLSSASKLPPSRFTPPPATDTAATTPSKLATSVGTQLRPPSSFGLRRPKNQP